MADYNQLDNLKLTLESQLSIHRNNLLVKFPVATYLSLLDDYPNSIPYTFISRKVKKYCSLIEKYSGREGLEIYHQLLLVCLMIRSKESILKCNFPADIVNIIDANFNRIIRKIERSKFETGNFLYPKDKFFKDLGVCRLFIIPAGHQKIYMHQISLGFLFRGGIFQFIKGLKFILFNAGGYKPFYRMTMDNTDVDLLAAFTPQGWKVFISRVAIVMENNKSVRGLCGTSWLFDPQLKRISPEFSYMLDYILEIGGSVFYQGSNSAVTKDATFFNPRRKELYQSGTYVPTAYMVVISRLSLLGLIKNTETDGEGH
jgi:hypothetical protein